MNEQPQPQFAPMKGDRAAQKKVFTINSISGEEGMALFELMKCWRRKKPWRLEKDTDSEKLWKYAQLHWLGALAGAVGVEMDHDEGEVAKRAKDLFYTGMIRHARAMKACARIEGVARSAGIRAVALKGPALVAQAYGGVEARQYGDIDLFIPTQKEAWLLLEAIGEANRARAMDGDGFWSRLQNPGKIEADYDGFILEITCVEGAPSDPMQEMFARNKDRMFGVGLLSPDPSAHFVYLMAHMLTHHLCARLIWWMDLVALNDSATLDIDWIVEQARAMELSRTAGHMSAFIQTWIDPEFPTLGQIPRGRRGFMLVMLNHEVVFNRALGPQYVTPGKKAMLHLVYLVLYFLLGDSVGLSGARRSTAARWMAARYARGLKLENRFVARAMEWMAALVIWPLSRMVELFLFSSRRFAMRP